jgi:hypothetical protein
VVVNILQNLATLPPDMQAELLALLNQQFQAVQAEVSNSPEAADQRAAEMANLIA